MLDDILVPTDGSESAATAVSYASDLANTYGATVHTLCVADARTLENAPHRERMRADRADLAERTCAEFAAAGVQATQAVRTGVPHRAILEYATEAGVDLVVMGTHGRTGVERYLLGSVTEKVVRLSDVPVLTVKSMDEDAVTYPYEDVLVPTDGSDGAAAATDLAVDVASTYGARLHALSVVDTMAMGLDVRSDAVVDRLEAEARRAVEAVERRAADTAVTGTETAVEYGTPHGAIRSYVEANGIDLVVMGTHGRSGLERYLLGSVAEKTVRTSPAPVVTVRPAEGE
ncbi:universal stress protein [Salinirubellus salinus]|uniref:Universal stress protein n=1 Tax=Salinirubellus salinus TaxID=1364945 RepID=A0A9E7UAF6_9EURY|nr:universal stress protein [Salinirubellus salinus]UWM53987.1 universal stress protein [Salinirubellus salinus]